MSLRSIRRRATVIGAVSAILVLILARPASADLVAAVPDPSTPVSSDGTSADPAVLEELVDFHVVDAVVAGGESVTPASATVYMTRTIGGARFRWCTGWLIGADTVVTAGHCLFPRNGTDWYPAGEFTIWPGRDGSSSPYGSCGAVSLHSVTGWTEHAMSGWDYGAVKLDCSVGDETGTFGFMWQSSTLTGTETVNRGYPADRPSGTQSATSDRIRVTQDRELFYLHDTRDGSSGGPVYTYDGPCAGPCGVAVHAHGFHGRAGPGDDHNSGPRITEAVFNNFVYWRDL